MSLAESFVPISAQKMLMRANDNYKDRAAQLSATFCARARFESVRGTDRPLKCILQTGNRWLTAIPTELKLKFSIAHRHLPLRTRQAEEIIFLAAQTYGAKHPDQALKDPKLLARRIAAGDWYAGIAYDQANAELVAHAALLPQRNGHVEVGRLLVHKEWRNKKIGRAVTGLASLCLHLTSAQQVLWSECPTHDGTSQAIFSELGLKPAGLYLGKYAPLFGEQRESVLYSALVNSPQVRATRPLYAPTELEDALQLCCDNLGLKRVTQTVTCDQGPPSGCGALSVKRENFAAANVVTLCAKNLVSSTRAVDATNEELNNGAHSLLFKINISELWGASLAGALMRQGYLFAALEPHRECDLLVLQHRCALRNVAPSRLVLQDKNAERLKQLICKRVI